MKFTILPDFEANRKRRAIRRQKRGSEEMRGKAGRTIGI